MNAQPRRQLFQFSLKTLFVIVCVVSLGLGWWLDGRRLRSRISLLEEQVALLGSELKTAQTTRTFTGGSSNAETSKLKFNSVAGFIEFIRDEPDWYEFQDAQRVFSKASFSNEAVSSLIELLGDSDDKLRVRAASALGAIKARPDVAVPALIRAMKDEVPNVRWHAAFALRMFGPEAQDAVPALRAQMNDDSSIIATESALSLKEVDPSIDIGPRLLQLLSNQHYENRWRALEAVPSHVPREVAEPILTRLHEEATDATVRESIAKTMNVYTKRVTTASSSP